MEPHYRCGLCDSSGQSNCMMSHLTGKNHRYKFARSLPGNEPSDAAASERNKKKPNKAAWRDRPQRVEASLLP